MATATKKASKPIMLKNGDRVKVTRRNGEEIKGTVSGKRKGATGDFIRIDYYPGGDKKAAFKQVWKRPSQVKKF